MSDNQPCFDVLQVQNGPASLGRRYMLVYFCRCVGFFDFLFPSGTAIIMAVITPLEMLLNSCPAPSDPPPEGSRKTTHGGGQACPAYHVSLGKFVISTHIHTTHAHTLTAHTCAPHPQTRLALSRSAQSSFLRRRAENSPKCPPTLVAPKEGRFHWEVYSPQFHCGESEKT